jgi:hypothetical protein
MTTFAVVDDAFLGRGIDDARSRIVYVAPGVGKATAAALSRAMTRESVSLTIILDANEDAYRIGYGEPCALMALHDTAVRTQFPLRREAGLRIGLAALDEQVIIWAPTARSVEPEPKETQPNAIVLGGAVVAKVEEAVAADNSSVLPTDAEIGREALRPEELNKTIESLKTNPPAPFDLSARTRVFSTRFQFVEFEVRGAEWTERRIKLSSLLLNSDLPDSLQDILETQVRPFQAAADVRFKVPYLVHGRLAYEQDGNKMLEPMTQGEIVKAWAEIRDRNLRQLKGFGWLIRRDRLEQFRAEVSAYEETLGAWVEAFREHVAQDEARLIQAIVDSIRQRVDRSTQRDKLAKLDLNAEVQRGLQRLRVIEPMVRIVLKNVSWESSRDQEFLDALQTALPKEELKGWFEEFTAAKERPARVA